MFALVLLGALVLGPLAAISFESQRIKKRKAKDRERYREAMLAQQKEEEQRRRDVIDTLLKGR